MKRILALCILVLLLVSPAYAVRQYNYTTPDGLYGIIEWNRTYTEYGNYTWDVPANITKALEIVIIGGGGAAGSGARSGGGGGGGFINITNLPVNGTINIFIGQNGTVNLVTNASNGNSTTFGVYKADGGGSGGRQSYRGGTSGASGGGSGGDGGGLTIAGGLSNATPYQGNYGGSSDGNIAEYGGGGGGGSNTWGSNGTPTRPGVSGNGTVSWITGIPRNLSWGGDGGSTNYGSNSGSTHLWNITGYQQLTGSLYNGAGTSTNNGFGGHGTNGAAAVVGHGEPGVVILKYETFTPTVAFTGTPTAGDTPLSVQFTDSSTSSPNLWAWDFNNDGIVDSTLQNPLYVYPVSGIYSVNLTASNINGNGTLTKTDYIYVGSPVVDFVGTPLIGGAPTLVTFTDLSTGTPTIWNWTFGDGNQSFLQNPTWTYTKTGTYNVSLVSSNAYGNGTINTKTGYIFIYGTDYVNADFKGNPTAGSSGTIVSFTDLTVWGNSTTSGRIYNWSFGDGTFSSTVGNPNHVYSYFGTYTVTLKVNNTVNPILGSDTETKLDYIIISSNQQQTQYTPVQVPIKVVDSAGTPIQGVMVSATPLNFTAPANWAEILIGIQPSVNISGTTVSGWSGTDGSWVAPVLQSYRYHWTFINATAGINQESTFYPSEPTYRIFINTNVAVNNTYAELTGTNLTFTQPNASYMTLGMNYQDASGMTENVTFTVSNWKNDTVMYTQTILSGFTATSVSSSYTLENIRGDEFAWAYKAYRNDGSVLSQGNMLTAKGPSGVLVNLGIPSDWYRWLSLCVLFMLGGLSSQRTKQFWVILIPIFAAMFFWFGWFVPTGGAKEETILLGVIIMCAVLGVMIYMKTALRDKHGVGGPGAIILNIIFYLIVLQASIGFINGLQVWSDDYSAAATTSGYNNVDITTDIPVVTNAGGGLVDTISLGIVMLEMTFAAMRLVFTVLLSIVFIYPQLMQMFPFLAQSAQTQALLVLLQIGIYITYLFFFLQLVRGNANTEL